MWVKGAFKSGIAGVVAALAILFLSILTAATVILIMRQGALGSSQLPVNQLGERRVEEVTAILYNVSLCHLLEGNYTRSTWKLLVMNTGSTDLIIDGIVVEKMGRLVFKREDPIELKPSEYKVFHIGRGGYHDAKIYVHTGRGSLFLGEYGVPDPYSMVEMDGKGRCHEP